jgi:N4-gp56 family major capsid protein
MAKRDLILNMVYDKARSNNISGNYYTLSSATTESATVYGDAYSGKELEPAVWVRSIVDAAQERMRFMQVVKQHTMPDGNADFIIPRRKTYLADSSWNTSAAEYTSTDEIDWTQINTMDGIQTTPVNYNYGVELTNDAIHKNALQLVEFCREELSYKYENAVDTAVRNALLGTVSSTTAVIGPVEAADAVTGSQIIFGGDSSNLSDSMDPGDTLTTDMIARARRLLMSTNQYYYSSNVFTKTTSKSNPWEPPYVLFIAPEQEEALVTDSQFVNAAEYGSQEVILNGEIGRYLDCKMVVTTKVPSFADNDYYYVQGSQYQVDTDAHACALIKPQVAGAMVWARQAKFKIFDWPSADRTRMTLNMKYAASAVQSDAIIRMVVNDA